MSSNNNNKNKIHYFYKITNTINGHFYYGIHSTYDIDDNYMGSGTRLRRAYKKYGIENFTKEILKFFNTREECAEYEAEVVTEALVLDNNCYNISCGGETFNTLSSISVIDKDGNKFRCACNDEKWLNGEYTTATVGMLPVIDIHTNEHKHISCDEYHANKERYKTFEHGVYVRYKDDSNEDYFIIPVSEYAKNKDMYINRDGNKVLVKDSSNKCYRVDKNDPRYLNGELVNIWKGRKHSDETKRKIAEHFKKLNIHKGNDNPMACRCWVYNDDLCENKCILKSELDNYLTNGWNKGRKNQYLKCNK